MLETDPNGTGTIRPRSSGKGMPEGVREARARFADAWAAGRRPRLEEFVGEGPAPARVEAVRELLALELRLRNDRGESPTVQEYLTRLPGDGAVVTEVFGHLRSGPFPDPEPTEGGRDPLAEPTDAHVPDTVAGEAPPGDGDVRTEPASVPPAGLGKALHPLGRINRYTLQRLLGEGGYGRVFLAHDEDLDRPVALKVPRPGLFTSEHQVAFFLSEARLAAGLKHPAIVTVFDVGRSDDGDLFVVFEYIEGQTLLDLLRAGPIPTARAVELLVRVAEALHYAHARGLVHRDLKPSNILIDLAGSPYVADFGLAVHEDTQRLREGEIAGTPAFMAPEQVRGETHRLDGRTDVWALGVILYRMLTGRLPFAGRQSEVFDEVLHREPKPPRQVDGAVPRELERVCLKCLSKRMTDRYTTAADLADDLRHWWEHEGSGGRGTPFGADPGAARAPAPAAGPAQARVVPRGLRSFDSADSAAFLALLPGPYGRDGLPECLRFWKARIEPADPEESFTVGLLYGPSGCGKSSLVKAGLIPRLAGHVRPIYIEAAPEETEVRLERGLRKACSGLPAGLPLAELLRAVREDPDLRAGRKLLIVLDQFEQWLHARRGERGTELVAALRHCDGAAVQCLALVRDDFGMAAMRFMNELEVPVVEGRNYATVDRFDRAHAVNVLTLFGRAFGQVPADAPAGPEQVRFLAEAVEGMAEEGKVVPIRLALFAEMFRGKPWTPASLKAVGGAEGIGVAFLEETLGAASSKPHYRIHEQAARRVLKALLPEHAADIKGHMRSHGELLEASGYAGRPRDFDDLVRILRSDLRLIMPGDPESGTLTGESSRSIVPGAKAERYYQLTHDYLVPSLRTWLTRKQRETVSGRAALLLEDRAALWSARPERRYLPTFVEWASIALLTRKAGRTPPQSRMMRAATRLHAARLVVVAASIPILLAFAALVAARVDQSREALRVGALTRQLLVAAADHVPKVLDELDGAHADWRDALARVAADDARAPAERTRAHLALVRRDPASVPYLLDRLLVEPDPREHLAILRELGRWRPRLLDPLWRVARDGAAPGERRLRAACALASFDPADARWGETAGAVARALASENPIHVDAWATAFAPVRGHLRGPLSRLAVDPAAGDTERVIATSLLASFASADPADLAELAKEAYDKTFAILVPYLGRHRHRALIAMRRELALPLPESLEDQERLVSRKANAAVALFRLGEPGPVWPLLASGPDPRVRTLLIHRMLRFGIDGRTLLRRLEEERDPSVRQALLLAVGEERADASAELARDAADEVESLFVSDPDPGVHAAAEWLLRRWGQARGLSGALAELAGSAHGGWSVNSQGQTMVFVRGGPLPRAPSDDGPPPRHVPTFAVSAHEVTLEQFRRFRRGASVDAKVCPEAACPMISVSWYDAARYCRWLSERERIPEDQMCYPPVDKIGPGMDLPADIPRRTGYRLPTDAEWEYACRAGTTTDRFYGETDALLPSYAWYMKNSSGERLWPTGLLEPNPLGLFDLYGNVVEWCHDPIEPGSSKRVTRGGHYRDPALFIRSSGRAGREPDEQFSFNGFRVARTILP